MSSFNLINGNIITLNANRPVAHSLTIDKGKIISIDKIASKFKTLDLKGATVIPGFIDAHFHLKNYGKRLEQIDLKGLNSLENIKLLINKKLLSLDKGEWILGFGWDQNLWPDKAFPSNTFLNKIAPHNPIYLTRIDGHAAWVNNQAIINTQKTVKELNSISGGQVINDCIIIV